MPVADLSDDDWLQQYLAGAAAVPGGGPATWAPYGGHPTNYGPPPNPLGAGAPSAAAPGPALGPESGDPRPSQMVKTAGLNLNSNPFSHIFALFGGRSGPTPPLPANALPLAWGNPTGEDYRKWLEMQLGSSGPPAGPTTAPPAAPNPYTGVQPGISAPNYTSPFLAAGVGPGAGLNAGTPIPSPRPRAGSPPLPPPRPATGSPVQTPRPADRWLIDRVNAGPVDQPRRGYQTALDLSSLFRRG